jgi:hypothetical protein
MNDTGIIDFTKGGYQGDVVEQAFRPITTQHMPFWWHFREVLRASDRFSVHWRDSGGSVLPDSGQRELVGVSLLNYAVYTAFAEAISFLQDMRDKLGPPAPPAATSGSGFLRADGTMSTGTASARLPDLGDRAVDSDGRLLFEVRRAWRAMYSSLYTSFNAVSNIVCVVIGQKPLLKSAQPVWNYTPKNAVDLARGRGLRSVLDPLERCRTRMEIRDHLDHYWVIWHTIIGGSFMFDRDFAKGRLPVHPETEIFTETNAVQRASDDMEGMAEDFDVIYQQLAVRDGFLDQYLRSNGWQIDYSDYGPPHNGRRPSP